MFDKIKPDELWIAFVTGANFKYIRVHHLVEAIGPGMRSSLSCQSSMSRQGAPQYPHLVVEERKLPGTLGKVFLEVTETFQGIMEMSSVIEDDVLALLKRFVVGLFERKSDQMRVNDAQKSRSLSREYST